jgi:site-specific recombinase XerD
MIRMKISTINEKTVQEYLAHLRLGKPVLNHKKKPIGENTAHQITLWLRKISIWFDNKDFKNLDQADIDDFRNRLRENKIKKDSGKPYSKATKRDIEYKHLRAFCQWLGKQDIVYYTDNYKEQREVGSLSQKEVQKMINASKLRDKVIISVLYDGGFRIGEFMNIKFCDVKTEERESKGYYKIRITQSKTVARTVALFFPESTTVLDLWLNDNKDKIGTKEPLIDLTYAHISIMLHRVGKSALKKDVHPHLLRHSSATYYCQKLNQFQLCRRYGWGMSSSMPQVYIDATGVSEDEAGDKVVQDQVSEYRMEVSKLKEKIALLEQKEVDMKADINLFVSKKVKEFLDKAKASA